MITSRTFDWLSLLIIVSEFLDCYLYFSISTALDFAMGPPLALALALV